MSESVNIRPGATAEVLKTILHDNRKGGLYSNTHYCRNCKRSFYCGTGRWSHGKTKKQLVQELRSLYVMLGEGINVKVHDDSVTVYNMDKEQWCNLCTAKDVQHQIHCRKHTLKEDLAKYSKCYCSMECWLTYSWCLADFVSSCTIMPE